MTFVQMLKRLPDALADEVIRLKGKQHEKVLGKKYQQDERDREEILKMMKIIAQKEKKIVKAMIDFYERRGGPEERLLETIASAFIQLGCFEEEQRRTLVREKKRDTLKKLKGSLSRE